MKKHILILAAYSAITGLELTSCTPSQKVETENVSQANPSMEESNQAYLEDVKVYRKEMSDKFNEFDQKLIEFNLKIEELKDDAKADYQKRLEVLEQKNNNLKEKINSYKEEGKEKWDTFKAEFSHDIDELAQAFWDLSTNNVQ